MKNGIKDILIAFQICYNDIDKISNYVLKNLSNGDLPQNRSKNEQNYFDYRCFQRYGKAIAKAFKESGDAVVMTARNAEKLERARAEIGGVLAFSMDVTKPEDWSKEAAAVKEKYGRLDVLINNAGGRSATTCRGRGRDCLGR